MGMKIQLFEVSADNQIFVYGDGWKAKSTKKKKVNTTNELVARITNSAALTKRES